MTSPALRHRQKVLARQSAPATALAGRAPPAPMVSEDGLAGTEYATLLTVLHEYLRSMADIQSHELRIPKKIEYARDFKDWVDGVVEADRPVQDEILVTMMIWAIDARDFDTALRLASFVLRHGLILPERYSRTPACFIAEEVAELALTQHEDVPHEVLLQIAQLVDGHDMPDPVTAKLQKALGRGWKRKAEDAEAVDENGAAGDRRA